MGSERQGIVHVIGPELGVTQPGMTIVCGDSHTATHGAFGALAFGIGTSEVEHVLATQCLVQHRPRAMRIRYEGEAGFGVTAKDLILATIGQMGVAGAVGHVVEYAGPAISALSMEGRMTLCNMTIEGGGRAGMVAPDDVTFEWFERTARPGAGSGDALAETIEGWRGLRSDDGAQFDTRGRRRRVRGLAAGHLGHQPGHGRRRRRARARARRLRQRPPTATRSSARSHYMGLEAGTPIEEIRLDRVFIGSCTNSRIGDLRAAASVIRGPPRRRRRQRDGRAGLRAGRRAGRGRGPRRGLPRRRLRLAQRRAARCASA